MLFRASSAGLAVFTCSFQLRPEGRYKASVESAARPGYPNFGGTRKFVEAHGCGRRRKAERHLTLFPDAVTSHGKNSTQRCSDSRNGKAVFPISLAVGIIRSRQVFRTAAPTRNPILVRLWCRCRFRLCRAIFR